MMISSDSVLVKIPQSMLVLSVLNYEKFIGHYCVKPSVITASQVSKSSNKTIQQLHKITAADYTGYIALFSNHLSMD